MKEGCVCDYAITIDCEVDCVIDPPCVQTREILSVQVIDEVPPGQDQLIAWNSNPARWSRILHSHRECSHQS